MKKIWILLALVLAVLFFGFREGLEPTQLIKAPPYSNEELDRAIALVPADLKDGLVRSFNLPSSATETSRTALIRSTSGSILRQFYTNKYTPATSPITNQDVDQSVDTTMTSSTPPVREYARALLKAYFVRQSSTPGGTPAAVRNRRAAAAARTPGTRVPPRRANTQNDNIWGPKTTGLGTPRNFGDGDGSGAGRYPTLLGPPRTSSPYMTGVGVVGASQAGVTLPSSASLGSDPLSAFLPFSRQPGDQELVTDPYRVAQSYSPASYSSKNEPVPFLTDFSAFQ